METQRKDLDVRRRRTASSCRGKRRPTGCPKAGWEGIDEETIDSLTGRRRRIPATDD